MFRTILSRYLLQNWLWYKCETFIDTRRMSVDDLFSFFFFLEIFKIVRGIKARLFTKFPLIFWKFFNVKIFWENIKGKKCSNLHGLLFHSTKRDQLLHLVAIRTQQSFFTITFSKNLFSNDYRNISV